MCPCRRWVRYGEGPPSPDNIDFHSTWGALVELSIAKTKGRTPQSASKNTHTYQPPQFLAWPLLFFSSEVQCSRSKRGSPFTLAFKWPFAPLPPTFREERRLWLKGDDIYMRRRSGGVRGRRSPLQSEVCVCVGGGQRTKTASHQTWRFSCALRYLTNDN